MGFKLLLSKIYLYIVVIQLIDHALVCWGWSSSMSSEWGTLPILVDPCHFPHVYPFFHLPDGSSKMLKNCEASHDRCFLSWNHVAICHCRWFEHHSTWNMRYHQDHRLVLATDGNFTWRWAPPQQSLVPRHSTMIVGPTGGGKSVVLNCLAEVQPFIPTGKSHESCWNIISPQFVFSDKLDSFWKTLFFGFGFFLYLPKKRINRWDFAKIFLHSIIFFRLHHSFATLLMTVPWSSARRRRRHWTCQPLCYPWTQRPSPQRSRSAGENRGLMVLEYQLII